MTGNRGTYETAPYPVREIKTVIFALGVDDTQEKYAYKDTHAGRHQALAPKVACYCPLTAYRTRQGGVTFQRSASLTGERLQLPCGQCVGCRLERSRQWALRCVHEKNLHYKNSYVTLTYNNDHLPPGGTLVKRDLSLFMKKLRNARALKVRFFGCGEYGEQNGRPHYHAILFNVDFPDKLVCGRNPRGDSLYRSGELDELWEKGFSTIGAVTFESAAYVARYCLKKVTGDRASEHYAVIDGDGVVYDREPEFTQMSRRPGIGAAYYERFGAEVRAHDSVVVNGHEVRPPRFYDTRTERLHPGVWDMIRKKRKLKGLEFAHDNGPDRRRVKEFIATRRLQEKKRAL